MGLSEIGDQVRQLLSSAGRSLNTTEPGAALVSRVNVVLMVFDDRLYHLDSGRWSSLAEPGSDRAAAAADIARAAAAVVTDSDAGDDSRKPMANVLLLLPPADFLATPVSLPGVAPAAIRPALQLQADSLLPGYDDPLSLAVKAPPRAEDTETDEPCVAFWLPTLTLNGLFDAFASEALFLTAVMPRPAMLAGQHTQIVVDDRDRANHAVLLCRDGIVRQCLQTSLADLEAPAMHAQWQAETATLTAAAPTTLSLHSADDCLARIRQQVGDNIRQAGLSYAMFPAAALAARHQFDKGKRLWLAAAALAALTVLGSIPFLVQSVQLRMLNNTLAGQQQLAAPARADQLAVRDFESRWGVLTEYPRQNVSAMLLALQDVISPSVLTSLELDEGYISIEGQSDNPQELLQQLEQNDMFTEVDFARATSNNRYFIDLRLTTVNFPAYQEWYFPESR